VIVHHPGVTEQIDLGRLGVWTGVNAFGDGTGAMAEAAAALESAGYVAIWLGGASNNHAIFGSLLDLWPARLG